MKQSSQLQPRPWQTLLILAAILLLGAALRFYGLNVQSLWNDEIASWAQSRRESLGQVITIMRTRSVHPPGHNILLYFLIKYVGDSEVLLRLPSALGGTLAIYATYLAGREFYGAREGLVAAALNSVLWLPVYYSQEARAYALLLLFTVLATTFWYRLLRQLEERSRMSLPASSGYILCAIVSAYLHYFGLYLIFLQGVWAGILFLRRGQALRRVVLLYLPLLLAYLPWVPAMIGHTQTGRGSWIAAPSAGSVLGFFPFLFNRSTLLLGLALLLWAVLLGRSLPSWRGQPARARLLSPGLTLVLWLLLPAAGGLLLSWLQRPVLTNRNLIISATPAYILLARSVTRLPLKGKAQATVAAALVAIFLFHLGFVEQYYTAVHKPQFREVTGYVLAQEARFPGAFIIGDKAPWYDYYFEQAGSPWRTDLVVNDNYNAARVMEAIHAADPPAIWLLSARRNKPDQAFRDLIRQEYDFVDWKPFAWGAVWLYQKAEAPGKP